MRDRRCARGQLEALPLRLEDGVMVKKPILFVQGGGKSAWQIDAELVASLEKEIGSEYEIRYPRMPNEDDPEATAWKRQLAAELATLGDGVILVAHSVGATILVDFLA